MKRYRPRMSLVVGLATGALVASACNREQRSSIDSAAGSASEAVRAALSVIDIDMGLHLDSAKKITDKTDTFAATDTIYASVHTSGTANNGAVVGRWTGPDGVVVSENTEHVTTNGDAYTAFHVAKPGGFPKGTYTLHVIIDGKEVRTKDVTVK
jgi:hypothetical protein